MINQYSTTGDLNESVDAARIYTDIAFSSDGLELYGISPGRAPDEPLTSTLYTIDPDTGEETDTVEISGLPSSDYFANALSALADGSLLVGSADTGDTAGQQILQIDPQTGVATPYPAEFPDGFASAGDFLSLPDGDVLAVGSGPSGNALFRIAPDNSMTQVGTVPESYGAAQSGGRVYLAGSNGTIYEIASVPSEPSTDPVETTTVATTGLPFYGATSPQDSGLCSDLTIAKSSDPASGTPVALGQTVLYSITLANIEGTAPAEVDLTDDLSSVADDATVVSQPAVSSGDPLTIDPIANGSFRISGTLTEGGQSTITYAVTINDPATGDHQLSNFVVPTGTTPPTSCEPAETACTTNPISDLTIVKSVDTAGESPAEAGEELTYSFLVTNTGNVTLTDVTVNEGEFTGSGELGSLTPGSVATLEPEDSTTFTATYTLTQADVDRGSTVNTATAVGVPPTGPPIESPPSTVEVSSEPAPGISVIKTADVEEVTQVGQVITYSFQVTNTGNVTLTDVTVNEGEFTGTGTLSATSCPDGVASLAPGAEISCTATYEVTQADLDAGSISNTATVVGAPPTGPSIESTPSTATVLTPGSELAATGVDAAPWGIAAAVLLVLGGGLVVGRGARVAKA